MVASSLSGLMLIWPDLGLHGFKPMSGSERGASSKKELRPIGIAMKAHAFMRRYFFFHRAESIQQLEYIKQSAAFNQVLAVKKSSFITLRVQNTLK
jgi:hypothetical protein